MSTRKSKRAQKARKCHARKDSEQVISGEAKRLICRTLADKSSIEGREEFYLYLLSHARIYRNKQGEFMMDLPEDEEEMKA